MISGTHLFQDKHIKTMQIRNQLIVLLLTLCSFTATWAEQEITVAETQNGTVTVDNPNAAAGETVTLTVTPDNGYEIRKAGVTAEATIDPGYAHAPRLMETGPTVGLYIELVGDDPSDLGQERTYTFTMPEAPLNVLINATFTNSTVTSIDDIGTTDDKPVHYFNLQGRYVGTSLNGVPAGIYVTNSGRKVIK